MESQTRFGALLAVLNVTWALAFMHLTVQYCRKSSLPRVSGLYLALDLLQQALGVSLCSFFFARGLFSQGHWITMFLALAVWLNTARPLRKPFPRLETSEEPPLPPAILVEAGLSVANLLALVGGAALVNQRLLQGVALTVISLQGLWHAWIFRECLQELLSDFKPQKKNYALVLCLVCYILTPLVAFVSDIQLLYLAAFFMSAPMKAFIIIYRLVYYGNQGPPIFNNVNQYVSVSEHDITSMPDGIEGPRGDNAPHTVPREPDVGTNEVQSSLT